MNSGILVYAYSQNYVTNFKIATDAEMTGKQVVLPNGLYSFYAFGYDNSSFPFTANAKCAVQGHTSPIPLSGGAKAISLDLTDSQCGLGAFAPGSQYSAGTGANPSNFASVSFVHCGTGALGALTTFGSGSNCGTSNTAYMAYTSGLFSLRVKLPIFQRNASQYTRLADGISGACGTASNVGDPAGASRIPAGPTDRPGLFPFEIEAFSGSDCSVYLGKHVFSDGYLFGPKSPSPNLNHRIVTYSTAGENLLRYFLILN